MWGFQKVRFFGILWVFLASSNLFWNISDYLNLSGSFGNLWNSLGFDWTVWDFFWHLLYYFNLTLVKAILQFSNIPILWTDIETWMDTADGVKWQQLLHKNMPKNYHCRAVTKCQNLLKWWQRVNFPPFVPWAGGAVLCSPRTLGLAITSLPLQTNIHKYAHKYPHMGQFPQDGENVCFTGFFFLKVEGWCG